MTGTFAALAGNPQLALQQSMLAMINHPQQPNLVEPKYWAPFVVVGEPAKPTP
jgi:CHAT domain-containing protein